MERIQVAIEKARKSRDGSQEPKTVNMREKTKPSEKRAAPETVTSDESALDALWKEVPSLQPDAKRLHRNRILAYRSCPEAAPYDMMRTKLVQQLRKNDWRRVAITSDAAGSGKTMTALNLAFSLARQSDLRIMVVDLDMRRPSMVRILGIQKHVQFSEALEERDPPEEHLIRYGRNLVFALNSGSARHSAELLQGITASRVLDDLEARYAPDVMIFDTPPLSSSDDTLAFLDQIDCALLLVEAEKTRASDVDKCEQELAARTNVIGVVLNKCRYLERSEAYGYYGAT
ncbi:CpsD/CapB family tyrosine-protein kinase [Roseovarius aestuariivivens]|uniref:CpsD/CapB family tyrosine-protein kinase n=1 Tax=Roseovarius aestuariivivens TaxID=1888910 RepID=UPI00108202C3|nr:CpsD/CapB family tyrosine-protein kinase [Roseovarius aestuariivivens]